MTKIILADNQAIFRTGAAKVLAVEEDFRIVAQCEDKERLRPAIDTFRQSVVLVAASLLPDMSGLAADLSRTGCRGIVIADNGDPGSVYLQQGFHGVIRRNVNSQAIITCIRQVARGEKWVQNAEGFHMDENDAVGARVRDRLTPKEMRIVGLIVQGCKNKEIANILSTTEQVIKNYLRSIYDKTGVSDRLELALFTIHHRTLAEAAAKAGAMLQQAV